MAPHESLPNDMGKYAIALYQGKLDGQLICWMCSFVILGGHFFVTACILTMHRLWPLHA